MLREMGKVSMSQTIIIESSEEASNLMGLNLNMYVGTDVIHKKTAKEAIELLTVHPAIDLIITRSSIGEEKSSNLIESFLMEKERSIPLLILGEAKSDYELAEILNDSELKDVVKAAGKALGVTAKMMVEKIVPEYYPVSSSLFLSIDEVNCDIYLRLKKNAGKDLQYLKRIHKGDQFTKEEIQRYISHGEKFFFIPADHRLSFANDYSKKMVAVLGRDDLSNDERIKANENAFNTANENILNFGLSEETVELSNASISSISQTVKDNPSLSKMFDNLLNNKAGYMYQHCQLITHFAYNILSSIDWGSNEQKDKLGFVAFFHDIILTDENLARIRNTKDLNTRNLPQEQKQTVLKHAQMASELLRKFPSAPIGTDVIIKQHHGHPTGMGLPDFVSNQIAPLTMVFIVAEEATDEVITYYEKTEKTIEKDLLIAALKKKFTTAKWQKIITPLESIQL